MLEGIFTSSRKEFINFINIMSDAVFVMKVVEGISLRYEAVNKSGMEMAGLDSTVIGKRLEDVFPIEEASFLIQKYREVLEIKSSVYFEHETQDNRIGESTLNPIFDYRGNITYILSVTRDITDWKKAKRELEEYKQKYTSLVEYNPEAIYELDLEGNITGINEAGIQFVGYKREEILNHSFVPLVSEVDLDRAFGHFNKAKDGIPQEYEIEIIHKEGHSVSCLINNVPIFIDGKIIGIYGIAKNITEEKKLLQALKESEERYRLIADNSKDLIQILDVEGEILYASPSHEKVLGHSPEGFVRRSFVDFLLQEEVRVFEESLSKMIENKGITSLELRLSQMKGGRLWIKCDLIPILNEEDNLEKVLVLGEDITERKKHEEEIYHMAYHDQLTGLPNRILFSDRVHQALVRAKRNQSQIAILYLDCDHFKPINDELGHDAGDEFLKSLAGTLNECIRESDTVARIGGDEFNIVLPDIQDEKEVIKVAERILSTVNLPWECQGRSFKVSMSIGIALYPKDGDEEKILIKKADKALYEAKESGRNTFKVVE